MCMCAVSVLLSRLCGYFSSVYFRPGQTVAQEPEVAAACNITANLSLRLGFFFLFCFLTRTPVKSFAHLPQSSSN